MTIKKVKEDTKKKPYTFTFHLFQVLEQATLNYGGRNQNSGFLRGQRRGLTGKG